MTFIRTKKIIAGIAACICLLALLPFATVQGAVPPDAYFPNLKWVGLGPNDNNFWDNMLFGGGLDSLVTSNGSQEDLQTFIDGTNQQINMTDIGLYAHDGILEIDNEPIVLNNQSLQIGNFISGTQSDIKAAPGYTGALFKPVGNVVLRFYGTVIDGNNTATLFDLSECTSLTILGSHLGAWGSPNITEFLNAKNLVAPAGKDGGSIAWVPSGCRLTVVGGKYDGTGVAANNGGAIYAQGGAKVTLVNAEFSNFSAAGNGGAVYMEAGANLIVEKPEHLGITSGKYATAFAGFQTKFTNCEAEDGGAIFLESPITDMLSVANTVFSGNSAAVMGDAPSDFVNDFASVLSGNTPTSGFTTILNSADVNYAQANQPNSDVTVQFVVAEGPAVASQTIAAGTAATRPQDPAKNGYSFDGWYKESTYATKWNFLDAVNTDITLYARWVPEAASSSTPPTPVAYYTLTYLANGGSGAPPASTSHAAGSTAGIAGAGGLTRSGYVFDGWRDAAGGRYGAGSQVTMNADVTLWAVWVPVQASSSGSGSQSSSASSSDVSSSESSVSSATSSTPTGGLVVSSGGDSSVSSYSNNAKDQQMLEEAPVVNGMGDMIKNVTQGKVPSGSITLDGAWSLINLTLAVAALLICAVIGGFYIATLLRRKKEYYEEHPLVDDDQQQTKQRSGLLRLLAVVAGLLLPLLFILLENLGLPMVFINRYTMWFVIVFLLHLGLAGAFMFYNKRQQPEEELLPE